MTGGRPAVAGSVPAVPVAAPAPGTGPGAAGHRRTTPRPLAARPLAVVRPGPAPAGRIGTTTDDMSGADATLDAHLGWTLYRVLDGLRFPVPRWRVLAQADAWGVGGSLRLWLTDLPEGSYAGVHTVVAEIRRSRRTS